MKVKAQKYAKVKILKEGKFIRFCQKDQWEFFERNNCSGIVIIIAMTNDKKVLFVEQYRPPVGKRVIEFPAGLVNDRALSGHSRTNRRKKETLSDAAKRELLEETGFKAKTIIKILRGPVSSGVSSDLVTMVRAFDLKRVTQGGGDAWESIKKHEVPLKEVDQWLKKMERKGYLIEPKIYTGLYFLKYYSQKPNK